MHACGEDPGGDVWSYELKVDGYRLVAVKTSGRVTLYSRRDIDRPKRFKYVASALASLPEETMIDGESSRSMSRANPTLIFYRSQSSLTITSAFRRCPTRPQRRCSHS
jgi:bifunctional non-homologous end joining protein LigD